MKWLIINIEAFSSRGLKKRKTVGFSDLPQVVQKFLSVFPKPFIILDECFVAGTKVDCIGDNGVIYQKDIVTIVIGDRILNAWGMDYVEATNCKEVKTLVKISAVGNVFICSKNHPFFTVRGWKPAKDIRTGDYLMETTEAMRLLRRDFYSATGGTKMAAFLRKELLRALANDANGYTKGNIHQGTQPKNIKEGQRIHVEWETGSNKACCPNTGAVSYEKQTFSTEDGPSKGKKWYAASCAETGWKWERFTAACIVFITRSWSRLAAGVRCVFGEKKAKLPVELQVRYCPSYPNDCHRGRWDEPQWKKTAIGQEKRCYADFIRVESAAVLEQGNPELDKYRDAEGRIYCYDIKAARHQSFSINGVLVHNSSKIKTNVPMKEEKKSSRTRVIKLLNKFGERCIMTGTVKSKSPLNVIDQYDFLKEGYFPESMWEMAERYCIMETIKVGRGRRVLISQKDYEEIRKRLRNAWVRGGDEQLKLAKESIFRQYVIDYAKQEHIIQHRQYSPFINQDELLRRIAPVTMFVRREDVFDIQFDRFVKEPIMKPVVLSDRAKQLANELVDLGFTDNLTLGKAPALELMLRLQDICNGFEPIEHREMKKVKGVEKEVRVIEYKPLPENPKLDMLIELLEEIDVEKNQVVVWCSRKSLLRGCADRFTVEGYTFVEYDGNSGDNEKADAERIFQNREAQLFLANQASGAYGLNCLSQCSYAVYICIDGSVEKYHQSQHRILRGRLYAPKFAYHIYARGTIEERQQRALRVGQELIGNTNTKKIFTFV